MNKNTDGDSWGQLLSDFGIEDAIREETAQQEEPKVLPKPISLAESKAEDTEESSAPREKKSIFSRFPKVNFFGAPPEVSLDSVIEGTKSPTLGGKTFTDNTMEKMPVSQERKERQRKDHREQESAEEPNAWSTVASQIDTLASGTEERSGRRTAVSIFDDPLPESDEYRALKDLIGEQPRREEEPEGRHRGRGRRKPQPEEREEREVRGRGSRYRPPVEVDDLPESDFEVMDDEPPVTRGRGRRGSRYSGGGYREPVQEDVPQEEWSEIDAALQSGRGSRPAPRGGRNQRHDNQRDNPRYDKRQRSERREEPAMDRESFDGGDSAIATIHGDTPSWDEAIGDIIAGNIARHRSHAGGRGRR